MLVYGSRIVNRTENRRLTTFMIVGLESPIKLVSADIRVGLPATKVSI